MCDTLGVILEDKALFAKNSDRSPNEPQVCEFYPARDPSEPMLKATYIEIDQVSHTHSCLLSRPSWMWGAEMGVNEHGVCIGNEAVFTKGAYAKTGLTGMDLLRLALERGASAAEARDVIISLLERHGQGGNCGFDHNFYYDNAFLIMDRRELFVLETAGRNWVYKQYPKASISNRLTIGREGDAYSGGEAVDFKKKYSDLLFTFFSGSRSRWEQTCEALGQANSVEALMGTLRRHDRKVKNPLCQGSVSSTCMHAGGLIGDHTTASMVVELDEEIKIWLTGSSTPCISLFKPWKFGEPVGLPVMAAGEEKPEADWIKREQFHRSALGRELPAQFYEDRDALETNWLNAARGSRDLADLNERARAEEEAFYKRWVNQISVQACGSNAFKRYWAKKNEQLTG